MSTGNISFDDSNIKSKRVFAQSETPAIIAFLIRKKIVKSEKAATVLLLVLAAVCLSVSAFLIRSTSVVTPAIIDPSLNSINQ